MYFYFRAEFSIFESKRFFWRGGAVRALGRAQRELKVKKKKCAIRNARAPRSAAADWPARPDEWSAALIGSRRPTQTTSVVTIPPPTYARVALELVHASQFSKCRICPFFSREKFTFVRKYVNNYVFFNLFFFFLNLNSFQLFFFNLFK